MFAALTAIVAKIRLEGVDSDFAMLIRTCVIMITLTRFVHVTGSWSSPFELRAKTWRSWGYQSWPLRLGAATVIGSFVGSIPSLVAVILNYVKRGDARGTWTASHYRWQIRTFWFALLWALIGWVLIFTLIGAVVGVPILIALTLWLIYRIGRGWLRLGARRPMYAN